MILEVCIIFYVISLVQAYNLSEDCSLRLGAQNQGFIVNCQGGKEQNEHFISHLRQSVLLPLIVKSALKTDLCAVTSHLSQVTCSNPSSSDQTRNLRILFSRFFFNNICYDFFSTPQNWPIRNLFSFSAEKYWWKRDPSRRFVVWSDELVTTHVYTKKQIPRFQDVWRQKTITNKQTILDYGKFGYIFRENMW